MKNVKAQRDARINEIKGVEAVYQQALFNELIPTWMQVDRRMVTWAHSLAVEALLERGVLGPLASVDRIPRMVRTSRWFQPGLVSIVRSVRRVASARLCGKK